MSAKITECPHGRGEIVADGIVHGVGLAAADRRRGRADRQPPSSSGTAVAAVAVYAFGADRDAHLLGRLQPAALACVFTKLLRRLDHAAIFVMIAGTYTPFTRRRAPAAAGRSA